MAESFSSDTRAEFKALREDALLLSLSDGSESGYLVLFFSDPAAASAGVERVFASEETLGAILASTEPTRVLEFDAGVDIPLAVEGTVKRPCAVIIRGAAETLPPQASAVRMASELLSSAQGSLPSAPGTANLAVPDDPDRALLLLEWTTPDGRLARLSFRPDLIHVRLEHDGQPGIPLLRVDELPDVIRALSKVAGASAEGTSDPLDESPAALAEAKPRQSQYPSLQANRVALARLYAVYPEGLSGEDIERLTVETGLEAGLSAQALVRLTKDGRVVRRKDLYFVKA